MATAYVEYGHPALKSPYGSSIHGPCLASEALVISGSAALGTALTALQAGTDQLVARVTTDNTACFVAVGTTPNPAAVVQGGGSNARRYVPAGGSLDLPVTVGQRVGVIAVS